MHNPCFSHIPVLLQETICHILPNEKLISILKKNNKNQIFIVDATIGGAGHASHLIEKFHENILYENFILNLIGIDQDQLAITAAHEKLTELQKTYPRFKFSLFHDNFDQIIHIVKELNSAALPQNENIKLHGFYADFGVSSPQFDTAERGFAFSQEAPMDMRMNQSNANTLTAEKILLTYPENELTRIFFEYGEEPKSKRLARAIITDRTETPQHFQNTKIFAEYAKKILKYPYSRTHPATRVFQALRIEVNHELEAIQILLSKLPEMMHPASKAGFISFHSLEDRLVKKTMRLWQMQEMGREQPRGGITATIEETAQNPRARSARLRIFDFVENITLAR